MDFPKQPFAVVKPYIEKPILCEGVDDSIMFGILLFAGQLGMRITSLLPSYAIKRQEMLACV